MRRLRADRALHVLACSPVYETPPAGGVPQGDYLNAAVVVVTAIAARALLDQLLDIERALGRVRPDATRWGPRTIDLDILWIEGESIHEDGLVVPHPRLAERAFALRPLLDLVPDATDVQTGAAFASLAMAHEPLTVVRAADGWRR